MSDRILIPGETVDGRTDIGVPVATLLQLLYLLPKDGEDATGLSAVFKGPPLSVALIEANATALSKYWAAGLGLPAFAAGVVTFWKAQEAETQTTFVWAAAICVAAAVLAIAYIVGSDVRGRSAAAVATISARAQVATHLADLAAAADEVEPQVRGEKLVPLPAALGIRNIVKRGDSEELGWQAIAVQLGPENRMRFLVVKGGAMEWASAKEVEFT